MKKTKNAKVISETFMEELSSLFKLIDNAPLIKLEDIILNFLGNMSEIIEVNLSRVENYKELDEANKMEINEEFTRLVIALRRSQNQPKIDDEFKELTSNIIAQTQETLNVTGEFSDEEKNRLKAEIKRIISSEMSKKKQLIHAFIEGLIKRSIKQVKKSVDKSRAAGDEIVLPLHAEFRSRNSPRKRQSKGGPAVSH